MEAKDWFLAGVEAILWYLFVYTLLYSIKNPVNLKASALVLLVIVYLAALSCPWFRHTCSFKELFGKKGTQKKNKGALE